MHPIVLQTAVRVLYGLGPEIPFLISAVLYALMSVATPLIRSDLRPKNDASPIGFR